MSWFWNFKLPNNCCLFCYGHFRYIYLYYAVQYISTKYAYCKCKAWLIFRKVNIFMRPALRLRNQNIPAYQKSLISSSVTLPKATTIRTSNSKREFYQSLHFLLLESHSVYSSVSGCFYHFVWDSSFLLHVAFDCFLAFHCVTSL